jgi:hypothetical protein
MRAFLAEEPADHEGLTISAKKNEPEGDKMKTSTVRKSRAGTVSPKRKRARRKVRRPRRRTQDAGGLFTTLLRLANVLGFRIELRVVRTVATIGTRRHRIGDNHQRMPHP